MSADQTDARHVVSTRDCPGLLLEPEPYGGICEVKLHETWCRATLCYANTDGRFRVKVHATGGDVEIPAWLVDDSLRLPLAYASVRDRLVRWAGVHGQDVSAFRDDPTPLLHLCKQIDPV